MNLQLHRLSRGARLMALERHSKGKMCKVKHTAETLIRCMANPVYAKADLKKNVIRYENTKGGKAEKAVKGAKTEKLTSVKPISAVYEILNRITDKDAALMGFEHDSKPVTMILRFLPVIPPGDRVMMERDGLESHDQLTQKYVHIVKANNMIKTAVDDNTRKAAIELLYTNVFELIADTDAKMAESGKVLQNIKTRLQGKDAVIRSALMGKRVNFSARTVISPDPSLRFGQIRIPEIMAPKLTVPVRVFKANMHEIRQLLTTVPIRIRSIIKKGTKVEISPTANNIVNIEEEDIVNRWLRTGDYIVFNRQPTLHKQGLMGFEVVLGKPLSIGLALPYVTPLNADFDK